MTAVLVCGSRDPIGDWTIPVRQWLHWVADGLKRRGLWSGGAGATLLHGGCRGIDHLADSEARAIGYKVVRHDADWDKFGNAAGPFAIDTCLKRTDLHSDSPLVRLSRTKSTVASSSRARVTW